MANHKTTTMENIIVNATSVLLRSFFGPLNSGSYTKASPVMKNYYEKSRRKIKLEMKFFQISGGSGDPHFGTMTEIWIHVPSVNL